MTRDESIQKIYDEVRMIEQLEKAYDAGYAKGFTEALDPGHGVAPEPEPIKFSLKGFEDHAFAVQCNSEEEAKILIAYMYGRGVCRCGDWHETNWRYTGTCYSSDGGFLWDDSPSHYAEIGVPIIPFRYDDLD
jgi:hypothetical protein